MSNYGTIRARLGLSLLPERYWRWTHRDIGRQKAEAHVLLPAAADSSDTPETSGFEWVDDFPAPPAITRP